ncbi:MAG: 4'-phosphopantetheinyl transferase superfamily protein [Thiohalophilus sp.]|jgi:4'-phosphopantetheinyl transferase
MNIDPEKIDPDTLETWLAHLPEQKRAQIRKHRHHENRVQSAAGWLLVERTMRDLGFDDFSLSAVDFNSPHKSGSPYPADFNISHSGTIICAAALASGRIGIDVEKIRALKGDVIHKYLSEQQARECEQEPSRFFDYWTQIEAVLKAHGQEGIVRLREVILHEDEAEAEFANRHWYLTRINLAVGYAAHIATDIADCQVVMEKLGSPV